MATAAAKENSTQLAASTFNANASAIHAAFVDALKAPANETSGGIVLAAGAARLPCPSVEPEPNTALLTAIVMFATFTLALLLKKLRESFYLGRQASCAYWRFRAQNNFELLKARRALGDFGVLIAITIVALIVHLQFPHAKLQFLDIPDTLDFTNPTQRAHGLLIAWSHGGDLERDAFGILVALIAALLVFILLYVETEITEFVAFSLLHLHNSVLHCRLLLSRKERGTRKGCGMNYDLVLMGACALLCSVHFMLLICAMMRQKLRNSRAFGLPWLCPAAVQSLAHCSSLTVFKKRAPGANPEVDYVIEQRITTIGVSALIGVMAFFGFCLRFYMQI